MKNFIINQYNQSYVRICFNIVFIITLLKCIDTFFWNDRELSIVELFYSKPLDNSYTKEDLQVIQEIDTKYCGGPCKFLSLNVIVEQETRSQIHARNFAFTAGLTNRTFVLPNVGNSRLGACKPYDFEYYYDIQWAKDNAAYFKYITMEDFKAYLMERNNAGVPATEQIMAIFDSKSSPEPKPQPNHCLSEFTKPPKDNMNKVMTWNPKGANFRSWAGPQMVQFLKSSDDIDILHINLNRGNAFSHNPKAHIPIPYSPKLVYLADKTAQDLGSFVAVHWRMETIRRSENLPLCAEALVQDLEKLPSVNVFLLTDYPHSFTQEQQAHATEEHVDYKDIVSWVQSTSSTFHLKSFTPNHHRAIQYLYNHHPFTLFESKLHHHESSNIDNWHLLEIPDELQRSGELDMIDIGWLGILDKLMAIRAEYFFAGKGHLCARASTFTKQIVEKRQELNKREIQYFGF